MCFALGLEQAKSPLVGEEVTYSATCFERRSLGQRLLKHRDGGRACLFQGTRSIFANGELFAAQILSQFFDSVKVRRGDCV